MIKAIVTMPPYAPYIGEVLKHPIVNGIRLNTVMPVKESLEELLKRLSDKASGSGKELWIDLKCRQLRIKNYGVPPFTEIELTHNIMVYTPCMAYFSDRKYGATILEVDKNRLIMQEGPSRVVGPGESVTITHPTLTIEGYFTETDKRYIEAGNKAGIQNYMLSFVERKEDIDELKKLVSGAKIIAKIESQKGVDYVKTIFKNEARLMAARGDLFLELHWPHTIISALEILLEKDPDAVVASRIFSSLNQNAEPSCEEIGDINNLLRIGYKTFMFGDDICLRRESIIAGLNLLNLMTESYIKNV